MILLKYDEILLEYTITGIFLLFFKKKILEVKKHKEDQFLFPSNFLLIRMDDMFKTVHTFSITNSKK